MEIKQLDGDLLSSTAALIAHQVNCQNSFGSGVAKAVRDKWPVVYEKYKFACEQNAIQGYNPSNLLGKIQPVKINPTQKIVNLFAQENYGYDGKRYTSYDALDNCLKKLREYCDNNNIKSVAFPHMMSCCRGGADWGVVSMMIVAAFRDSDINVEIWKLKTDQTETS